MTFWNILHEISIWVVVLPLMAGLINYKGLNGDSKWIFYMTVAAVPPQILTFIVHLKETALLNILYNLYTPVEFILMYGLFRGKYEMRLNKRLLWISAVIYGVISVWFIVVYGIRDHFLERWECLNSLIYIIWIMTFLKEQYTSDSFVIQKRNPFAWYVLAFIIYSPCTVLVFSLYYYIRRGPHHSALYNLWRIPIICNILLYLLFAVGLFISRKEEISRHHERKQ
ncbi:MAG TPA: hypothetical protein VL978_02860 [Puia sp.]|nr:hypothetical protein [Puia sp.]